MQVAGRMVMQAAGRWLGGWLVLRLRSRIPSTGCIAIDLCMNTLPIANAGAQKAVECEGGLDAVCAGEICKR